MNVCMAVQAGAVKDLHVPLRVRLGVVPRADTHMTGLAQARWLNPQDRRVVGPVWHVAVQAILQNGRMRPKEWAALVGVAARTARVDGHCRDQLFGRRAVGVVAIAALHKSFVNAVVERHGKLRLLLQMAAVAKLGLRLHQ